MSLRGSPVVETTALPDGREAEIRIGVPDDEARRLAREIADGLSSGRLEPTTGALEPLADAPSSS